MAKQIFGMGSAALFKGKRDPRRQCMFAGMLFKRRTYIMEAKEYLYFIVHDIHTTVVATADDAGLPVTCAIDMMDSDGNSLYFLTAKGKSFYERLKKKEYLLLVLISAANR